MMRLLPPSLRSTKPPSARPPLNHTNIMIFGYRSVAAATLFLLSLLMTPPTPSIADESNPGAGSQFYEVRTYVIGKKGNADALDSYLQNALIPALDRQGIGPVGVFATSEADKNNTNSIFVVIPYDQLTGLVTSQDQLASDTEYQTKAAEYLNLPYNQSPYERIRSELLSSMACWPIAKVTDGALDNDERVFELRVYESATEKIAETKIDMFNAGEVPIFLDCNILPIFIGKCVAGPQMPSMTYLTTYPSEAERLKSWKAFVAHPDWATLKVIPKYLNTVSRIDKFVLKAKPYSQM